MQLSFIIINHHSEQYLRPCIDSILAAHIPFDYEIIIINNDAQSLAFSLPRISNISMIEAGKNLGFGKANNRAAEIAKGTYLCFLNPDTLLLPNQSISEIVQVFEKDASVAIVGPRLITDRKTLAVQPWCAGYEITLWETIRNNFGIIRSRKIWKSDTHCTVAWVSGAALFAKKQSFDAIGGFDDNFFMYFEDVDLCRRIRSNGETVLYFPQYSVFHWSGKSSPGEKVQKTTYYTSQDYYFEKHFGKLTATLIKIIRRIFSHG